MEYGTHHHPAPTHYRHRLRWLETHKASEAIHGGRLLREIMQPDGPTITGAEQHPNRRAVYLAELPRMAENRARYSVSGISRADGSHYLPAKLPEDATLWPIYLAAAYYVVHNGLDVAPLRSRRP
jgi:hypothetical protein